ncbi:MAG: carbohydrate-binding protein [Thermoguttaceae bacterium]
MELNLSGRRGDWRRALAGGGRRVSSKPEKRYRRLGLECLESRTLLSAAPTVATPAAASPSSATGTTANLSVLGADAGGEANLTYTWATIGTPPAPVVFSSNGSNAAKNTVATFTQAGTYNFAVTIVDQAGLSVTSTVSDPVSFGLFNNSVDIGSPALAGSLSYNVSSAAYTVKAGGADIGGTSDQFRYTYEGYSGNGQLTARVTSVSNTNSAAKAGVMFRDSAVANAAYAFAWVSPSNQVEFETRSADGATASYTVTASAGGSPVWVQLVRFGASDNQFSASYSLDDVDWTQVGTTRTVTMATAALAGLAVTSHNVAALNTSVIDNVTLSALPSQALPTMPPVGYDQAGQYPAGSVNTVSYYSPSEGADDTMWVYTPPGYNKSQKYPDIYAYPGIGAGADTIFDNWCVDAGALADNLIGQGKIHPVIIVSIDDNGNNENVQSDTLNVIIPYIDSNYSTYADANNRGLYGYSWGGQYTLNVGCSNLNTFHYLCPSSAAVFNTGSGPGFFPNGGTQAKQDLKCLLLSCGTADWDGFYPTNEDLANYCTSNDIPHGWLPVIGEGHDAGVWRPAMWNFLQMADAAGIANPPVPKSAYSQVEAVNYDIQAGGVVTETCSDTRGGQDVGTIQNGDYLVFNNVDFGVGAVSFNARVASATSGGNIAIHLDSPTGTLVGTCAVPGNGGWQTWVTQSCSVSGATGIHKLYLVFTGGSGYLFNVNWWEFNCTTLPTTPLAPNGLVATPGVESVALSWTAAGNATSYDVERATTSGGPYTTIANVAATNYTDFRIVGGATVIGGTTYYYVVSALNDGGESANSAQASATPTVNAPSPWMARDVGTPGLAGGESFTNGVFTVYGSGAGIAGPSDAFRFVDVPATGNCTIVARVSSVEDISANSEAGVMIRQSMAGNAANAFIAVTPSNGIIFQSRPSTGGTTSINDNATGLSAPYWVMLVRSGNTFTAFYSPDGINWTQLGSTTFTMASTAYVGLAVSADLDYTQCEATFDHVTAPGWAYPQAATPIDLVATPGVEQVSLSWAASANAQYYNVKQATSSGGPYTTIATVTATNYTNIELAGGTSYYYVVSAVSSLEGESNNSAQVVATPISTVPSPWLTQDIGAPGVWGSASETNGVFTVTGSGADIWNSADAFRFVYTTTTSSSFTVIARVASLQNVNSWSKAGAMIRDSLDPDAANAFIAVTPGNGVTFQYRSSDGGGSSNVAIGGISAPYWVELVESGETFTGYCSPDGKTWTEVGSTTLTSSISTAYVGLAVTSHNNSSLCTATFDNVSALGWPLPPLVANATAVSSSQVNLTWNPQSGATSYNVKRSTTSGGPYTTIATGLATTNYTDTSANLSGGSTYYYVVSAIVGGSETANGPEAALGFSKLTGAIIGTPGSYNNSGNTIANVFDGNLNTFFDGPTANGCWAGLDFGAGASDVITQINYCPRSGFESRMVGGIFQGANQPDFSDAVTLATVTTQPATGVLTPVNVADTAAFRYVRYLSPDNSWGNVAELEFLGYSFSVAVPQAPTGLIAGAVSRSQINLTWNAVANATTYNVKRATTSGGPYTTVATGVTGTGYTDTGLSASTSYYYVVSAVNTAGESGNSTQASATPTVVTAASASPSFVTGTTTSLSVLGANIGGEENLSYTWSMASGPAAVTFSANGANAAKNTVPTFTRAGSYVFQATIANAGGLSTTSSVGVTVNQAYSSLSVSPGSPNLTGGSTQQFTATALDQFGQPLSSQPAITWTLVSGPGTLTSGGLYTPPYASGSATIRAASGSYSSTATVTFSSQAQWNAATSSFWTTSGNWNDAATGAALAAPGVRGLTGDTVLFESAQGPVVRLDGANPSLAAITFNSTTATSYTIAQGSGGSITLQGGSGAMVSVLASSDTISAPVHLASNTTFNAAANSTLTMTGSIDGSGSLTMTGTGQLTLNAANTFSGGLIVQSGTVVVGAAGGLLDGSSLIVGAAGAFNSPHVSSLAAALLDSPTEASVPATSTAEISCQFSVVGCQSLASMGPRSFHRGNREVGRTVAQAFFSP